MSHTTHTTCPGCGATLTNSVTGALCPACLLSGVLRAGSDAPTLSAQSGISPADCDPDAPTSPLDAETAASAGARSPRATLELPCRMGSYTLTALLGQGGMGTVYEATQDETGRRLALKLLDRRLDTPEMRRRFLREGRLAARVNHPASLYVYGSEEIEGVPAITMEIAPGGTLQDALERRGPLPVAEAVDAVLDMIRGLDAALQRGVLHRDIKPSNCFVSPDGSVKVGDFGLSISTMPGADSFVTQTGAVMGTPAFASPEQLRGDEVDARSDLYSVGATLFTLLTGRAPFSGENPVQVVAHVIDTPAPLASSLREGLPQGLSRVIARCLAKEPEGRYADYAALRDALLPFSSVVPEPATQTQRGAAGWIDYLAAFLPTYAALMITVGPEALFIRPLYVHTLEAWRYHLLVFGMGFCYFAIVEGLWGAGLGKWIMGLRVVRTNGRTPGVGRALLRIVIPMVVIELVRVPLSIVSLPAEAWGFWNSIMVIGLATLCPWVVALLWLTAKRGNGFATVWDLATGTRVVVRPKGAPRPNASASTERIADPESEPDAAGTPGSRRERVGPFRVLGEVQKGAWLSAHDPVLRRAIWLVRRTGEGPSEARRAAARPGCARWLQTVETPDSEHQNAGVWDAYEAPRGTPLRALLAEGPVAWSTMRHWLHDLASELWAAQRDGTLPLAIGADHVWIADDDGRAMILDEAWPRDDRAASDAASDSTQESASDGRLFEPVPVSGVSAQQRFLRTIASFTDPLSIPLHARPAVQNLRSASFEKLTYLTGTLRGLLNKPSDVTAGLRAASLLVIPGYTFVASMLGIAGNTDPGVSLWVWIGRALIAALVMMHFMALSDLILAVWQKSTGLSTFGLEAVTPEGRASRRRLLARWAIMWLPVVVPTAVLGAMAFARGGWIPFEAGAAIGAVGALGGAVVVATSLRNPARGIHDRLAGVWVGRR